ncbi:MAG TPA: sugar phosphate nucleotidyltransferase [bacterium]|nr:sugar phosphate nucleotidyltransferase [bacterium]
MKAIIPVAGMGTRLRPHTHTQPKALMHVAGKPILAHIVDELLTLGITQVVFVVGHLGEKVEGYVREHYAALRTDFIPQGEPLGNGHAVYVAREFLDAEPALILFGDTIVRGDLAGLVSGRESLVGVKEVADPRRLGVVELDTDGYVRRLVEKPERPPSNLAVIGAYFIKEGRLLRAALERLVQEDRRSRGEFWLADGLQLMIDGGERMGVFPVEHWYDCGTAEALLEANRDLLDTMQPPRWTDGAIVLPPSYISPAAVVDGSVIGPHVSIAEGAQVVNSVIRDSIINAHAQVDGALLEHSLVGEHAVVRGRPGRINVGESSELELR